MVNFNRKMVQFITALSTNSYWHGFATGRIYQGELKKVCIPGLNCYSCPGALGSCPIGSLQAVAADIKYSFSFYIAGILMLTGLILGRFVCGWLCPFGLIQELLHKLPSPKFRLSRGWLQLKYLKYAVLLIFVLLLPALWGNRLGMGSPTFCQYICPAGTLEAGIPLVLLDPTLRSALGLLFSWKMSLLILTVLLSVMLFRPFCRFICPLGAIYALFNPISLYRLQIDEMRCTKCASCSRSCQMDIEVYKNPNDPECIRCGDCVANCPNGAIKSGLSINMN